MFERERERVLVKRVCARTCVSSFSPSIKIIHKTLNAGKHGREKTRKKQHQKTRTTIQLHGQKVELRRNLLKICFLLVDKAATCQGWG